MHIVNVYVWMLIDFLSVLSLSFVVFFCRISLLSHLFSSSYIPPDLDLYSAHKAQISFAYYQFLVLL